MRNLGSCLFQTTPSYLQSAYNKSNGMFLYVDKGCTCCIHEKYTLSYLLFFFIFASGTFYFFSSNRHLKQRCNIKGYKKTGKDSAINLKPIIFISRCNVLLDKRIPLWNFQLVDNTFNRLVFLSSNKEYFFGQVFPPTNIEVLTQI